MTTNHLVYVAMAVVFISACLGGCAARPRIEPGTQAAQALHKKVTRQVNYDYLLYLPKDFGRDREATWPLVVFLHGSGERGSDLQKVKLHGPPQLVAQGKDFPFILLSPQCPADQWWQIEDLQVLLDDALAHYPVDHRRIYLTGLSMGGAGTWDWVIRRPDLFAAAVPVCGPTGSLRADRFITTPVWAFHGGKDPLVPPADSRDMVAAIRKAGGEAKLTIYPGVGHNAWDKAYADQDMWRWLLAQRK